MAQYQHILTSHLIYATGIVLALLVPGPARGQNRLDTGADITFRAFYSYDSNLFRTRDAQGDEFSTYAVNLGTAASFDQGSITFGADIEDNHYVRYPDQDDTSYDVKGNLILGKGPLKLNAFGQHYHTIAPLDTTNLTRAESDTGQAWAYIDGTPFYLFGIVLAGNYEERTYVDYDEHEYLLTGASISIYGMYDRHTKIGLKYFRGDQDYDEEYRYDVKITRTAVYVDIEHKDEFVVEAEVGYEEFEFITPRTSNVDLWGAEGPYADASLDYIPNDKWEAGIEFRRSYNVSYSADSHYNAQTRAKLSITCRPVPELRIEAIGSYTFTDEATTFDSDTYGAEVNVAYALTEWAEMLLEYNYDQRYSYVSGEDYERHVVSLGLAVRW